MSIQAVSLRGLLSTGMREFRVCDKQILGASERFRGNRVIFLLSSPYIKRTRWRADRRPKLGCRMKTLRGLKVLSLSVSLGLFLAACSTTGGNPQANDPYEQTNRQVFDLDIRLDRHILLPTAQAYNEVVPEFARDGVHNFLLNLNSPVIFANDVLQGEASRGGETLARFVLNSTIGIGGLIDVAGKMGIPYHDEDFGQTLGVWGADEGPYLVLPFFGPSNPRDLTGNVVDIAFDPNTYISHNYNFYWSLARG